MKLPTLTSIVAIVLGGWLAYCPVATARDGTNGAAGDARRGQLKNRLEKVAQELNLTPDQRQQLKPILQEAGQKLKAVRADTSLSPTQKRQELKAIRQDLAARIKPILTPEQLAKWQQLRQQLRATRKLDS